MCHSLKILSKVAFRVTAIVFRAGEVVVHYFFVGLGGIGCVVHHGCVDNIVFVGVRSLDTDFWRRWMYFSLVFNIMFRKCVVVIYNLSIGSFKLLACCRSTVIYLHFA